MSQILLFAVAALTWGLVTGFFWRARAWLPYYAIGSSGLAILLVIASREFLPIEDFCRVAAASAVNAVAPLIGVKTTIETVEAGSLLVIGVPHHTEWTVLAVGLESSGLLESAALIGLVGFFPAQSLRLRTLTIVAALLATFVANVARLLIIVASVGYLGQGYLDFAHIVLGRIVFFIFAIAVFWFAVTRPTLRRVNKRVTGGES